MGKWILATVMKNNSNKKNVYQLVFTCKMG